MKRLTRLLTFTEILLKQRSYNVRVDIARVALYEVIIDALVKVRAQATDV